MKWSPAVGLYYLTVIRLKEYTCLKYRVYVNNKKLFVLFFTLKF